MSPPLVDRAARRARVGVALLFLNNGALLASILPCNAEITTALGLEATFHGLSIAAFPVGAILVGLTAAVFARRFGSEHRQSTRRRTVGAPR
ncbi:hypothetical protein [Microbacterium esteraromaticum]|uniref:hypothetical protein n=1 Tax=Microbacterium esteraromaticum TaxID=57043 RepID=UPI001C94A448|nr:hypothetical protein [Microbacterium esteraromaticum]MBY6061970.1 hypothetical protein [Microbacterium esteraromaticum]